MVILFAIYDRECVVFDAPCHLLSMTATKAQIKHQRNNDLRRTLGVGTPIE
jgi:hypothetical protein